MRIILMTCCILMLALPAKAVLMPGRVVTGASRPAPAVNSPRSQTTSPAPFVQTPWLAVAETNSASSGKTFVRTAPVTRLGPWLVIVTKRWLPGAMNTKTSRLKCLICWQK